ncbi:MAG: hypothetical protein NTU77_07645 [Actinobacteria bacterium]|nr:hypothetical protein [Actinomycetota bacterium]
MKAHGVEIPAEVDTPGFALTPQIAWSLVELASYHLFPTLAPSKKSIDSMMKQLREQVAQAEEAAKQQPAEVLTGASA